MPQLKLGTSPGTSPPEQGILPRHKPSHNHHTRGSPKPPNMATTTTISSQPPDPKTLQSWEDAFAHPLPVVRKLEQQLRRNIDENRAKLRSLVGTSYRDLLGTAERIIEMDGQIQVVDGLMGEMGRRCNAGVVERVGKSYGGMKSMREGDDSRERRVAQTKVLQNCIAVTGRVVKRGGDALVAAKVLVLARLVFKSLSEMEKPPSVLEDLRRKLGLARKRLLGYISRSLVQRNDGGDKERTVKTLCAYSLISSVSPRDVLRYFMQVRFEQLEAKAEVPEEGSLLRMLDLYSQTLLDTRELFPRRFADSLAQLTKVTLVKDKDVRDVRDVHELSLDVYEQWISDDVRNFHPWVRHDQLSTSEVGDALASWTKQAQECLLQGLRDALQEQTDARLVLEIRQKVLSKYLALSAKVRSDAHATALEDIRLAFLARLEDLAAQAAKIADFSVIDEASSETPAASMWDLATANLDLNGGAIQFRKAVIQRQHGHSPSVASATAALDMWIERLQGFTEIISSMRTIKWDDDLEFELDDLTEDEPLQVILSKKDPQALEARLHQETTTALQETYWMVGKSLESKSSPPILLRVVREVDRRRRGLGNRFDRLESVKAQPTFIAALHRQVATSISEDPVQQYAQSLQKRSHTPVTLWDGTPPLPVQPCPATFRFLKTLHRQMTDAGNDFWSPDAVQAFKIHVAEQVAAQMDIAKLSSATELSLTNGHADDADQAEDKENKTNGGIASRDRLVQLQFDVLYLQRVFGSRSGKLEGLVEDIGRQSELDATLLERLRKNASEYWKRTYLLFGLLAVGQTSIS